MNFIITMKCNKGCPYCFASKARNAEKINTDMTMETYKSLLDKVSENDSIKLLGGEPTQHPNFKEFFEEALSRDRSVTLISNFLFNQDILDTILKNVRKKEFSILINSTDLDKLDRMKTFSRNYNTLYNAMYEIDTESNLSIGITFEKNKDWKYYIDYLNFVNDNLVKIESLRLSIPNPDKIKGDFFFLNNKDFGKKFLYVAKWAIDNGISPRLDCILYPCMFENKEEWKFINKFINNMRTTCGNDGCPNDIFPDKTASFCYPVKESIKIDSTKYDNSDQMTKDMMLRYQILESKMKLPEACTICKFKSNNMCNGPCLAYYDLSKENVGINV